jgi:hypothetical protein
VALSHAPLPLIASFKRGHDTGVAPKPQNGHFIALRTGHLHRGRRHQPAQQSNPDRRGGAVQLGLYGGGHPTAAYTTFANGTAAAPTINTTGAAAGNDGVGLASGNTVRGLNVGTTTAANFGIRDNGGTVGNLTIDTLSINNTSGGGIEANNGGGAIAVTLGSLVSGDNDASNDGANGINLESITSGSFTVSGAVTISDTTGVGIRCLASEALPSRSLGRRDQQPGDIGISIFNGTGTVSFAVIDINGRNNKGMRIDSGKPYSDDRRGETLITPTPSPLLRLRSSTPLVARSVSTALCGRWRRERLCD